MQSESGEVEECNSEERWWYDGCLGMHPTLDQNFWFCACPLRVHSRNFIIKTCQRSCTKHLIASGKLLVSTVQESDGAPTAGNPQITCSKVKRIIIVVQKRYYLNELLVIFCWISVARKQASCAAYTCQRAGKFHCTLYNIDVLSLEIVPNQFLQPQPYVMLFCPLLSETD